MTQSVKPFGRNESNEMDTRVHFIDLNPDPKLTEIARCITARHDSGISNRKAEHSGVFVENSVVLDNNEKFAVAFGLYTKCWGEERAYKINLKNFQKK